MQASETPSLAALRRNFQPSPEITNAIEWLVRVGLGALASIPIVLTLAIAWVFVYESQLFFEKVSIVDFFTAKEWTALFDGENFGIAALASATLVVAAIAMLVAAPLGVASAVYLSEYAPRSVRFVLKPLLESITGVPSVVLGYFGFLVITPLLQRIFVQVDPVTGDAFTIIESFNLLTAGVVTGVAVVPIISALTDDALRGIPRSLREGALALGMDKRQTILQVLLPSAFPAILASFALAASRVFGETMIAAIAAGKLARFSFNPLQEGETIPAYILDASAASAGFSLETAEGTLKFQSIFAAGAVLFAITLLLSTAGNWMERRYRRSLVEANIARVRVASTTPAPQSEVQPASAIATQAQAPTLQFGSSPFLRRLMEWGFQGLTLLAVAIAVGFLGALLWNALSLGLPRITPQFLMGSASNDPNEAGIFSALVGTAWVMVLTLVLSFPVSVGAALFLEEYAPKIQFFQWVEINIANLAALPSIIYGLLGLELFVRWGAPLTGGRSIASGALVLAIIVLPFAIVSARTALRGVPEALHQAGIALGMSRWQVMLFVVLPSSLPGILTGTFLSLALAVGETAALIAIGAVAFITFVPSLSLTALQSQFSTLPVQIYFWTTRPEPEFQANGAAAILTLMAIVLLFSGLAALLRGLRPDHRL